jgi:hypothetical protein
MIVLKLGQRERLAMKWIDIFEAEGTMGTLTKESDAKDFHITMKSGAASAIAEKVVHGCQRKNHSVPSVDLQTSFTMV